MRHTHRLLLLALIFAAVFSRAQEIQTPTIEVFAGYSLLNTPAGDSTQHGWNGSATVNLNRRFGVTADIAAVNFDQTYFYPAEGGKPDRTLRAYGTGYHVLFGPTLSLRRSRFTPFTHGLFGLAHGTQHNILSVPGGSTSFGATDTLFAAAIGGGFDLKVNKRLALRPFQAEYVLDRWNGFNNNRFRYSGGLVFRFCSR